MPRRLNIGLTIAASMVAGAMAGPARSDDNDTKREAADAGTKQLLLLMDQDRNGKISKAEFMAFMEAEFARLDTNHNDELDVYELTGLRVRRSVPGHHNK
jgi:hypothetical protein